MYIVIPNIFIVPLFAATFFISAYLYQHIDPDRRVLNLPFGLMAGGIVLMVTYLMIRDYHTPLISQLFLLLGLVWLGTSIFLWRQARSRI